MDPHKFQDDADKQKKKPQKKVSGSTRAREAQHLKDTKGKQKLSQKARKKL